MNYDFVDSRSSCSRNPHVKHLVSRNFDPTLPVEVRLICTGKHHHRVISLSADEQKISCPN